MSGKLPEYEGRNSQGNETNTDGFQPGHEREDLLQVGFRQDSSFKPLRWENPTFDLPDHDQRGRKQATDLITLRTRQE
jgi:hypothetical protein